LWPTSSRGVSGCTWPGRVVPSAQGSAGQPEWPERIIILGDEYRTDVTVGQDIQADWPFAWVCVPLESKAQTVAPADASPPITYTWTPAPDSGQGTAHADHTWATAGTTALNVTASNCGGAGTAGDEHDVSGQAVEILLCAQNDRAVRVLATRWPTPVVGRSWAFPPTRRAERPSWSPRRFQQGQKVERL
jgi:hypothetical protein